MISLRVKKKIQNTFLFLFASLSTVIAIIPLFSIIFEVVKNGIEAINLDFFIQLPGPVGEPIGGIANAIQGTLILVTLASVIGVPIGVITGIYLYEYGKEKKSTLISFSVDLLYDLPSIVVGIFVYIIVVSPMRSFSTLAGALALAIVMIPIIAKTTEESLTLVPPTISEAGIALGIPKWKNIVFIVLNSAKNGVLNGIVLAVARITGETAPLIMTCLGSNFWFSGIDKPINSLTLLIWRYAMQPYPSAVKKAWGAAFLLLLVALALNLLVKSGGERK
ncbi:MAG: phosphate ABC transporter permease PstA [Thermoproteota archaeon]|jgi:phosphate transport system permease protein